MLHKILKPFVNKNPIEVKKINPEKVKNILIVKQHNQLGDMLCTLPLIAAVRKKFYKAHITLVASKDNYEIMDSSANKYLNRVILFKKSPLNEYNRFFRELKDRKYDIGIVPSTVSFSRTSHLINFLSGAKIRVGVKSADGRYNKSEYLLNVKSDFVWDKYKLHQTERNLEIANLLNCRLNEKEKNDVRLFLDKEEITFAKEFIKINFPNYNNKIIGYHIGAAKIKNRWDLSNFAELIIKLYKKFNNYVLLTKGPLDRELTTNLTTLLKEQGIKTVITNYNIRKVAAILSEIDLYITNDTGTMHTASYVGTPLIALFGPTNGYEWGPLKKNQIYIQSPTSNINDIKPDLVYKKSIELLTQTKNGKNISSN
ncbi:MAG: glycosyltransferase family 9 protein [Ignavibacteria bacterium]|nr:glycosyltransferase family 9 protein [Ignavibacteria bacterium]